MDLDQFLSRWQKAAASERANYQLFLSELCDILGVPRPDPATGKAEADRYVFEKPVTRTVEGRESTGRIDLYKAGCFVLEAKQGANDDDTLERVGHGVRTTKGWDLALVKARNQADAYIRDLPAADGRPPFLIVCDVGYVIELYAEFTRTGGTYHQFPDPNNFRIYLDDLRRPEVRERLQKVWTDPLALDPSRYAARVTREVAARLAELARALERRGHAPDAIAPFIQRCLFTLFAEDVELLPRGGFERLLDECRDRPEGFPAMASQLWREMAQGVEFSTILKQAVPHFNGGLFDDTSALPLTKEHITLLHDAARADWSAVEPAIFGTLLERALDPRERHKLGAHYTPRSYVERLVQPTILKPLREEWDAVQSAAAQLYTAGKEGEALRAVEQFHRRLCSIRVLDPACGSGNFLYVTLELLKRLEGEVLQVLDQLGGNKTLELQGFHIRPEQFHGLELNPRAVAIAQLVLWIGFFQWHYRATGTADTGDRPLLPKQKTIMEQDAVLAFKSRTQRKGPDGKPVTIWNGMTTKPHPVTGREVPDEEARIPVYDYANPARPEWPQADYIVGNPPFIGAARMRDALGDGYTEALREAWKGAVPESADFVMYWWRKAAELLAAGGVKRFGFITTNSIHQTFNRRVLEPFLADEAHHMHLDFAIPDHPWVDSADGAAVRIAMTVAAPGLAPGTLTVVTDEKEGENGEVIVVLESTTARIVANLRAGADLTATNPLEANAGISNRGVCLVGNGFIITPEQALAFGLGSVADADLIIRSFRNGKDLTDRPRIAFVIDAFGLTESEFGKRFPAAYQHVLLQVKPERDAKAHSKDGAVYARNWWIFAKPREALRDSISGLSRFIVTVMTGRHRWFAFLDKRIMPDQGLIAIASDDGYVLGALSSILHVKWSLSVGATLEDRPRYNNSVCFETFPFPATDEDQKARIRDLGERLDAHRKRQQELHSDLTLTGLYNVLEKLRTGETLTDKERKIHDDGLVSVLKQIHDALDAAVLNAYGWTDLTTGGPLADRLAKSDAAAEALEQEILTRLVALNHERAKEESEGKIRWLRPEYQRKMGTVPGAEGGPGTVPTFRAKPEPTTATLIPMPEPPRRPGRPPGKSGTVPPPVPAAGTVPVFPWPEDLPNQFTLVKRLLTENNLTPTSEAALEAINQSLTGRNTTKRRTQIQSVLATLQTLGHA